MTRKKDQSEYKVTQAQLLLGIHLDELGIRFQREFKFCERDWRIDLMLLDYRIGIEISGGNWTGGHRRGKAQEDEYDKLNRAAMEGWRVLQFTNEQVDCGYAKEFLGQWLGRMSK
jgi:very-short-patch-repair endonuclease